MIEKPLNNLNLDVDHQIILYLENISVSFDGFKVIDDLNLYIEDGELRCIIGPNGAGKTTLMDIITGKTRPDKGSAYFGQKVDLLRLDEHEIAQAGIGRKFQKPTVFEKHTLFTNLRLAMSSNKNVWPTLFDRLTGVQRDYIEEVLVMIGLVEQKDGYAGTLSHGQKQWLEIGMLLTQRPRLLLIDEPVAGMTHQETEHTTELLNSLMGEYSVIVVEHDMEFIRSIARKVTVLHEGRILSEGSMEKVQNDPKVIEVYLGA
ncbi:MAG: urea ABC transporter ATP-binding protein UrtD [Gammaproteobacteria bacterium]|jgi:urea transport system ATP-binding protein|uniref:ABC transporter domain-containing protein n=1 Tax=marine metagenome TaxID=408172 RepID=A0A381STM0_9ZZZZ|nr:urea ABC transporter ATP-binding protein UrtD [Gammaproteobacteria bacterium]|tara:strand:+ start:2780 stop:3559 length:780 start_codon:yes stop_codon:yes gene_type:complete